MEKSIVKKVGRNAFSFMFAVALVLSAVVTAVPVNAAINYSEYEIHTNNPEYSKTNYCKSIKFKGNKITIKGKFEVIIDDSAPAIKAKKVSETISPTCECYYGEKMVTLSKFKKLIKKNGNNCFVGIIIEVDDGEVDEMVLHA